jgi:hypothetical protein
MPEWPRQGDDGSSSYHLGKGLEPKHLDSVWTRQEEVNVDMRPVDPGLTFWEKTRVNLSSRAWRADIHYMLDGSDLTRDSTLFSKPFDVDPPVIIKARGFWDIGETLIKTINFKELGFRFHYDDWYKPPHHD